MKDEAFSTSDLGCAACVVALGTELLAILPDEGGRCAFQFSAKAKSIAERYWAGDQSIDASLFFSSLKNLKSRIYAIRNDGLL